MGPLLLLLFYRAALMPINNEIYHNEWGTDWDSGMKLILPQKLTFYSSEILKHIDFIIQRSMENSAAAAAADEGEGEQGKTIVKILDAGCGNGDLLFNLSKILDTNVDINVEIEYYAMDISATAVSSVLLKFNDYNLSKSVVQAKQATVFNTGFKDDTFDIVILSDVLDHVYGKGDCTDEMFRILNYGGILLFGTVAPNIRSLLELCIIGELFNYLPIGSHSFSYFITPGSLSDTLKSSGFRSSQVLATIGLDYHHFFTTFFRTTALWKAMMYPFTYWWSGAHQQQSPQKKTKNNSLMSFNLHTAAGGAAAVVRKSDNTARMLLQQLSTFFNGVVNFFTGDYFFLGIAKL